jgi:hypothetical protein
MSFDLAVLAMDASADAESVKAMFERCSARSHAEGELDERIVAFYEELRARFPDSPPYDQSTPWMSMPLNAGIDHVIMHLSFSDRSTPAIKAILELAEAHDLVAFDPQSNDAYLPGPPAGLLVRPGTRTPNSSGGLFRHRQPHTHPPPDAREPSPEPEEPPAPRDSLVQETRTSWITPEGNARVPDGLMPPLSLMPSN